MEAIRVRKMLSASGTQDMFYLSQCHWYFRELPLQGVFFPSSAAV